MTEREIDFIDLIANDILSVAKNWPASDEVAAIHGVWMEVGRRLGVVIREIRERERERDEKRKQEKEGDKCHTQ